MEASVKIGIPLNLTGVSDAITRPEFAAAVGLAQFAAEDQVYMTKSPKSQKKSQKPKNPGKSPFSIIKKIFSKF